MTKWAIDTFGSIPTFITTVVSYFNTLTTASYPTDTTTDLDFYISRLNNTYMSPIAEYIINNAIDDTSAINSIVALFENKFYDKYKQMFKIFKTDYNPIENYDMTEHEEYTKENGSMYSNANHNSINAFNSTTASQTDEQSNSGRTDGGETLDRDLTRHGNIGVTTTQQMIESTIDVYEKFNIISSIYTDFYNLLSLDII